MTVRPKLAMLSAVWGLVVCLGVAQVVFSDPAPADTAAIFAIQGENSSISSSRLTDRYYTNGIHLGVLSGEDAFPSLSGLGRALWGQGRQRMGFSIDQQIYTPSDTTSSKPPKTDRPYAGVLLATVFAVQDDAQSRSTMGLSAGVAGPSALGEVVQNGFHDLIGQKGNNGWHQQLRDEPVFDLFSQRVWRLPTGTVGGLETDVLPQAAGTLGTLKISVEGGVNVRMGQGLQNDYGAPRIRAVSGGDAFRRADGFGWYVFAGVGGQAVARDLTLDGNTYRDSASVKLRPLVGQADAGLALLAFGTRLTYTQVVQTQDFRHQKGGLHQFGSLALSVRF